MRAVWVLGLAISLASCSSAASDAEKEVAMLEKAKASHADLCKAKRKVADAYLAAHDQAKFEDAKLNADIECQAADLDER